MHRREKVSPWQSPTPATPLILLSGEGSGPGEKGFYIALSHDGGKRQFYGLTRKLEKYAGLKPDTDRADRYQNRLEKCLERLGHARTRKFRGYLRKRLYTELCVDLLQSAKEGWKSGDLIPTRIREVAKLGQLANPIVSFNVEMRRWLSV